VSCCALGTGDRMAPAERSDILLVTLLQGIWIILVAAHLLREGSHGRDV